MSEEALRDKILHILRVYPVLSPSMLGIGIGPHVRSKDWRPTLHKMIHEGLVRQWDDQHETHLRQYRLYTKVSLTDKGLLALGDISPDPIPVPAVGPQGTVNGSDNSATVIAG